MNRKKTKRRLMSALAIFLPWVVFLMDDNLVGALVAIVLQVTLIGWIPASIWAWNIVHPEPKVQKPKQTTTQEEPPKKKKKSAKKHIAS